MAKSGAVRCQRIGCDATFTEDDNIDGSCRYHDSLHYSLRSKLVAVPNALGSSFDRECKTGKHTTEKPITKAVTTNTRKPVALPSAVQSNKTDDTCSRCRQGFFCSDHGKPLKSSAVNVTAKTDVEKAPVPVKKIVGLNEPQICRNKGCGKTYKEKDNHETACEFHPGPAVFHDRMRGWKCCDIHVKEFDKFMEIPPCTKGWHNADAV